MLCHPPVGMKILPIFVVFHSHFHFQYLRLLFATKFAQIVRFLAARLDYISADGQTELETEIEKETETQTKKREGKSGRERERDSHGPGHAASQSTSEPNNLLHLLPSFATCALSLWPKSHTNASAKDML